MKPLAANPYCVWMDGHMRTYKTLDRARAAAGNYGRVGIWSEAEGWWLELPLTEEEERREAMLANQI